MNALIIFIVLLIVGCVVYYWFAKKRHKQSGCGGGCSYCQYHGQCAFGEKEQEENSIEKEN